MPPVFVVCLGSLERHTEQPGSVLREVGDGLGNDRPSLAIVEVSHQALDALRVRETYIGVDEDESVDPFSPCTADKVIPRVRFATLRQVFHLDRKVGRERGLSASD